jgi:hypothetical protein
MLSEIRERKGSQTFVEGVNVFGLEMKLAAASAYSGFFTFTSM